MFCNMQIFLDNLKIFLPKRRFIKFECVHHKNFDPIVMIYVIICQQLHVLVHRTNLHERRTMDPLSNYCKLTFAWHIKLLSILRHFRPTYFQEIQQILSIYIVIKNKNKYLTALCDVVQFSSTHVAVKIPNWKK